MLPGLGGVYGVSAQAMANWKLDRTRAGWQKDIADLLALYGVGDVGGNWSKAWTGIALLAGMSPGDSVTVGDVRLEQLPRNDGPLQH